MASRVAELLLRCGTDEAALPRTLLYNEGWMLRLVLDWFDSCRDQDHRFSFRGGARWYSEALLASRFLPTRRGDPLAESFTHADGIIGHFDIHPGERGEATVKPDALQFVVIEAKMGSGLSRGVQNADGYGQAARNVACIAHTVAVAEARAEQFASLGFFVVAPRSQINAGVFERFVSHEVVRAQVAARVAQYDGVHDEWFQNRFLPTLSAIDIDLLAWEDLIDYVESREPGSELRRFYERCLKCSPLRGRR